MKATLCIDEAVGETRRVLLDPCGKPFRIDVERWRERGKRARLDEVWWGRAVAKGPGGRGWFVDLGLDKPGLIEATRATPTEGMLLPVRIKGEAWADKGPLLSLADMKADVPLPDRPALHAAPSDDPFLRGVDVIATIREQTARGHVDAAIEESTERVVSIPARDGAAIAIDPTQALTVVDVDGGGASASAHDLNLAAAELAARQIALRGIGGLVVVDFVTMDDKRRRRDVVAAFREQLAYCLGRASEVMEMSPLGLCEAAIARRLRPVTDALAGDPIEREGLDAIRMIESEGRTSPGAKLTARVSPAALKWLEADAMGWQTQLAGRIGMRWTLEARPGGSGRPDVWAHRQEANR